MFYKYIQFFLLGRLRLSTRTVIILFCSVFLFSSASFSAETNSDMAFEEMMDLGLEQGEASLLDNSDIFMTPGGDIISGTTPDLRVFRWENNLFSYASIQGVSRGISKDGSSIIIRDAQVNRSYIWNYETDELVNIGTLSINPYDPVDPVNISADGSVVAGNAYNSVDFYIHAFIWDKSSGITDIHPSSSVPGLVDPALFSAVKGLSGDGTTVFGVFGTGDVVTQTYPDTKLFRWTEKTGMVDLVSNDPNVSQSGSYRLRNFGSTSDDGNKVVGSMSPQPGNGVVSQGFLWRNDGNGIRLLAPPENYTSELSMFDPLISPDGSVIAAEIFERDPNTNALTKANFVRWNESGEGAQIFDSLRSDNSIIGEVGLGKITSISSNGRFVVGGSPDDLGQIRAFRWSEGEGIIDLGTLKADNTGNSFATQISDDGRFIVGRSDSDGGEKRIFIFRNIIQDLNNLLSSFPITANDTQIAVDHQHYRLEDIMDVTELAREDKYVARLDIAKSFEGSSTVENIGSRTSNMGLASLGYGLDETTTIGGTISIVDSTLKDNSYDMDLYGGAAAWINYSENGLSRTGWQAKGIISYLNANGSIITRGNGLDNVSQAFGEASMDTLAAKVSIGKGGLFEDWLITPRLWLIHYRTNRDAYTEQGSDTNASYYKLSTSRTTGALELSGQYNLSEKDRIKISGGLEHDLQNEVIKITGSSPIPDLRDFAIESTLVRKKSRFFANFNYMHRFDDKQFLGAYIKAAESTFGDTTRTIVGLNYKIRF